MLLLKWKIYRVLNYVLLVVAVIMTLLIIVAFIRDGTFKDAPWQVWAMGLIFIFMTIKSIINVVIQFKNFPDKKLSGSQFISHVIALIMNFISVTGLIIFLVAAAIEEFSSNVDYPQPNIGKIILLVWFLIWFADCFTLYCQSGVHRFLSRNDKALANAMIESIGENN